MNDPYRTPTDTRQTQSPPLRPYRVFVSSSWEDNEDWKDQLELTLMEWHVAGYDVVTMMEDTTNCNYTVLLRYRS